MHAADVDPLVGEGEAGPCYLFQETLEQGRHVSQPQREKHHHVLRPLDIVLRLRQRRRHYALLPVALTAQQGKLKQRDSRRANFVTGVACPGSVGTRKGVE